MARLSRGADLAGLSSADTPCSVVPVESQRKCEWVCPRVWHYSTQSAVAVGVKARGGPGGAVAPATSRTALPGWWISTAKRTCVRRV